MWATKLIGAVVKRGRQIITTQPVRFCGRMFRSSGNGKPRVIVSGFSGPNLDSVSHFNSINWCNMNNVRPIIAGFTGQKGFFKRLTSFPMRARAMFFNPTRPHGQIARHVVHDIQTSRTVVKGFGTTPRLNFVVKGNIAATPMTSVQAPKFATERIVVQGFSANLSAPATKKIDSNAARIVVKGFGK